MFVIGARTTRHVNQDGVCTEIYFNFLPFHLVNVNNDIKARPIVNLSYNENVFKVLFGEDTISIFKSA